MYRTEYIGTNLYYNQEFVDDLNKEIKKLKENNKKKTWRCTERNHQIRCRDRKLERRDKKIDKLENIINKIKLNIEQNVIRMKNGKLLVELDVNEINKILEEIE